MADSDLRYTFACPSCAGSFSIQIERIPPVRARFSCPKCGKAMDFPAREEARVYMMLQPGEGAGEAGSALAVELPFRAVRAPAPAAQPAKAAAPPREPAKAPAPTPPPAKAPEPPSPSWPPKAPVQPDASPEPAPDRPFSKRSAEFQTAHVPDGDTRYTIQKTGFEGDIYDRRAMRILIRTGAVNEADPVCLGPADAVRADLIPDLKALFELRKNARFTPPAVCRKHTDKLAHYRCASTSRPLCEDCAAERKYGGTSVRVCDHCGGQVQELPIE
ncbi:MAG: hypothetical protein ABI968_10935 [Acidobacteriota bacterium]